MGYKMKKDESPAKNLEYLTTSGTDRGYINSAQQSSAAGAAAGGMPGLGMAAGALGSVIDGFKPEDPTEKGYMGASIGSKALELGAMGAQVGGPIGAGVGVVVGATIGGLTAKKEAEEARKQKRIQRRAEKKGDAISTLAENQAAMGGARTNTTGMSGMSGVFNPQDPYNFSNVAMKKGEIKMKPIKKLGAITGTISPNMSMAQYKEEKKFSVIAQELKPINEIKTDPNFATPGTEFKDNSGTNNQPETVTSGDRAKEAIKKAVKTAGTSALMLGDLDKNGEMSSYEKKRQNAIDKNMNK
jgi:hypothetical protein